MKAVVFEGVGQALKVQELPKPKPGPDQVLIAVDCCAVCRTDLHVIDGDLKQPKLPLVLGHEIVGVVEEVGEEVEEVRVGQRVGVPWLGWTCGDCAFCQKGMENLCDQAKFTGYHIDGGYAQYTVAEGHFCIPIPNSYSSVSAAPLLCAGLIGYRSLKMAGDGRRLGIYGFGAAAHIISQVAIFQEREVYAFTRPGDSDAQAFAIRLGACWAGDSTQMPPVELDSAIIFAPVGALVPAALKATTRGGTVVCGGIHMTDIPSFPYELLWEERCLCSVANLTREDAVEFMKIAPEVPVQTETQPYPLREASRALEDLREGRLQGAAVLLV